MRSRKQTCKAGHQHSLIRTSTQAHVNHSREFYRFLFENNPFPAWIYDIDSLKFLEVNCAAIEFYGYSFEEFTSMKIDEIRVNEEMLPQTNAATIEAEDRMRW